MPGDPGWGKVKRTVLTIRAAGPWWLRGARVDVGEKPPHFGSRLAGLPSILESPRAGPLRPQELTLSTCLQNRWQDHGRPLPQFHLGLWASVPQGGLARRHARLCQGKMRMCSSRREGGFNQDSCWLACPGPSKQLTGGGERESRACAHDMPGDKDIFSWLAACSSDTVSPMLRVTAGWQALLSTLLRPGSE